MNILQLLAKEYKAVSIVGMAKNAGKTTALNFLIEEAYDEGITLGITSTGRDGETVDLVTETEKPKVYLYEDTVVSVPVKLFDLAEAGLEILSTTKYRTSLGELYLCRVRDSGYVQIAGPVAAADTKRMCTEMLELGAELVLIDGAIDRKSVAAPDSSDAVILSTGAVLSRDIRNVVRDTAHVVELYSLPELEDEALRSIITDSTRDDRILMISKDLEVTPLDIKTGLGSGRYISEAIEDGIRYVYIRGAMTGSVIGDIDPAKFREITFILKDPTRIFLDSIQWKKLRKRGLDIRVLKNIKVCAVTVNPFSPEGYSFDSSVLCEAMREAIPDIPVVDVRK